MSVTRKLVFDSQLLPDGHLYCPKEIADQKNPQFKVIVTYEIETDKEASESGIEYANMNGSSMDLLAEEGMNYSVNMTTKGAAIHTIKSLPDDATWDDIQERINFIAGVRKGLQELDEGKGIPHQSVKEFFGIFDEKNYLEFTEALKDCEKVDADEG